MYTAILPTSDNCVTLMLKACSPLLNKPCLHQFCYKRAEKKCVFVERGVRGGGKKKIGLKIKIREDARVKKFVITFCNHVAVTKKKCELRFRSYCKRCFVFLSRGTPIILSICSWMIIMMIIFLDSQVVLICDMPR